MENTNQLENQNSHLLVKALRLFILLGLITGLATGHGDMEHVMGTVKQISAKSITVQTTQNKTIEVVVDAKTTYSKSSQAAQLSDLKVGDRVVIHAKKSDGKLVAQIVKFGVASESKGAAAHDSHAR